MATKIELQQANSRLADENHQLKLEIAALRTQLEVSKPKYPFVDKIGRRYRLEGNIRCFAPINHN